MRSTIRSVSKRKQKVSSKIARIKKERIDKLGTRCEISGEWGEVDAVHIVRQSHSLFHQDDPRNIVLGLRRWHEVFDDGDFNTILKRFPWRAKAILERMDSIDHFYTNRFKRRHGLL